MKEKWFKNKSWIYIPVHPMGFIITILAIVFMIPVCIAINRNEHSVSDELYKIFLYGTCTVFWWKWVAEKTS